MDTLEMLRLGLKAHFGSIKELQARSASLNGGNPYSRRHIDKVLRGERRNIKLVELAAELLKEYQIEAAKREERIQRLVNESRQLVAFA